MDRERDAARWQWLRLRIDRQALLEMTFDYPPGCTFGEDELAWAAHYDRLVDAAIRDEPIPYEITDAGREALK